ncbi:Carboxylic ester hydrolase [Sergentomyia squamirostris]
MLFSRNQSIQWVKFLLVFLNIFVIVQSQCQVTLKQNYGVVIGNGILKTTFKGNPYCAFLGIPYAKPPVGNLRFEPPQPLDLSLVTSFRNFASPSPVCIQNHALNSDSFGQEDCLYLNVYSKPSFFGVLKPVLVWIHGGFFNYGSAYIDGADRPDYLVDEDILVVTFNYRLGILGYLYRVDDNIIGNNGFRDQLAVLKWIQRNIEAFGGDPNRVTLMGWSAGSASIGYHMHTSRSMGLFHGAIMVSGTPISPWAYQTYAEGCVKNVCRTLGIPCEHGKLKESLKNLPADIFQTREFNINTKISYFGNVVYPCFVPAIESPYSQVLGNYRHLQLQRLPLLTDVPLVIGRTTAENWFTHNVTRRTLENPWNFTYPNTNEQIVDSLRKYLQDRTRELNNDSKKLIVGSSIPYEVQKYADYHATKATSPTYMYRFSYKKDDNMVGALHGDDLKYIFIQRDFHLQQSDEEIALREIIPRFLGNFVKYGNPTPVSNPTTPKWLPYTKDGLRMEIYTDITMVADVKTDTFYRWEEILQCLENFECERFFEITAERTCSPGECC